MNPPNATLPRTKQDVQTKNRRRRADIEREQTAEDSDICPREDCVRNRELANKDVLFLSEKKRKKNGRGAWICPIVKKAALGSGWTWIYQRSLKLCVAVVHRIFVIRTVCFNQRTQNEVFTGNWLSNMTYSTQTGLKGTSDQVIANILVHAVCLYLPNYPPSLFICLLWAITIIDRRCQ